MAELQFCEADVQSLVDSFALTASSFGDVIDEMQSGVFAATQCWLDESESRTSERNFDERMRARSEEISNALTRASELIEELRTAAVEAEVGNVAIMD